MATVYLICGKICSGKSTYAAGLRKARHAVLLSCDEITLAIFGQHIGEKHDLVVERTQQYLFRKALEILSDGIDVILDWGFWQKAERDEARQFFALHGIAAEFHYIDVAEDTWQARIDQRNAAIDPENPDAYYVDAALKLKFGALFEPPAPDEIDVRITA